jgi:hypothetical protein
MNPSETKETADVTTDMTGTTDKAAAEPVGRIETTEAAEPAETLASETDETDEAAETASAQTPRASSGIAAAAAGIVAAGLGVVALSGSWVGKIAAERTTLIGQIETSQGGTPAQQISAIYGDAWHTTALVNGVFALLALIVGVAVLAWPQKAGWVRAFAVAGVVLGVLGLIVSAGLYFDFFLELPSAGAGS